MAEFCIPSHRTAQSMHCALVHWSIGPNVNKVKLLSERTSGVPPVIFRLLLAHPSFLFQVFLQKYLVFLESGERYRKVESANKFEESCRISTTISDLVIGGGLPPTRCQQR